MLNGLLFLLALPALADGYERLAASLAEAGAGRGRTRLAVLVFEGDGGALISERILVRLAGRRGVQVVERARLKQVLDEQRLGVSGVLSQATVKELGQVLGVDALVTGAVGKLNDGRLEINARLIDARSAEILGAGTQKVERDWPERLVEDFPVPPLPSFEVVRFGLDDDQDCGEWRAKLDEMDESLLELKARYWAARLREGLRPGSLKANPGSEISDERLRRRFYTLLRMRHEQGGNLAVSPDEVRMLEAAETRRRRVKEACGGLAVR